MSMVYNAKRGWIEIPSVLLKENSNLSFQREKFEAESAIELIEKQLQNARDYANYVINSYKKEPNNMEAIKNLQGYANYLTKSVGPGMIGDFSSF